MDEEEAAGELLVAEEDSASLARQRARAERLLAHCIEVCRPVCQGRVPVVGLILVDNPDSSQVAIGVSGACGMAPHPQYDFTIETTPRWLEEASDEQIMAVFAHEIGHVVQGDCDPPRPCLFRRSAELSLVLAVICVFGVMMCLATGLMHPDLRFRYLCLAILPTLYWLAYMAHWHHARRRGEYQADAFAARHGFGDALLNDLSRTWQELDRMERWWAYGPTATHPPYPRRKRALERARR